MKRNPWEIHQFSVGKDAARKVVELTIDNRSYPPGTSRTDTFPLVSFDINARWSKEEAMEYAVLIRDALNTVDIINGEQKPQE